MAITVKKRNRTKPTHASNKWGVLRDMYISAVLNGAPISLEALARREKVVAGSLRNRAHAEGWVGMAAAKLKEQETQVSNKLVERSVEAISAVRDRLAFDESEVRNRHVKIARNLQAKAYKRIADIDITSISVRDAIELLRLGLAEERKGLGLPDEFTVSEHAHHMVVSKAQEVFERNLSVNEEVQLAVSKAIHLLDARLVGSGDAGK